MVARAGSYAMRNRQIGPATGPNLSEVEREASTAYHSEYRPGRRMTLLDALYRAGAISYARYRAGLEYARLHQQVEPPSEGVSGYGDGRHTDPTAKADRKGKRYTGRKIEPDGRITGDPRRPNRTRERLLEDARFAAFGVHDQEGDKCWVPVLRVVLFRTCCDAENPPTQLELTLLLTRYYKASSKQAPPYALGVVDTLLGRLALHFGLEK